MDAATREFVRRRALNRCEYCRTPQHATPLIPFHVEHIIATQHLLDDSPDNLCLACDRCNAYKGPNLSSLDNETSQIVQLFHPRRQNWSEHFRFEGPRIIGTTPTGRATVRLLQMNTSRRIELREHLIDGGEEFP
jgi:hypothetical protein